MVWRKLSTAYVKKVSRRCEELVKFILSDVAQACRGFTFETSMVLESAYLNIQILS